MSEKQNPISRRGILAGGGAAALSGLLATQAAAPAQAAAAAAGQAPAEGAAVAGRNNQAKRGKMPLAFGADGRFKIAMFNDTQDGALTDKRTIELIGKVLDQEKPGFALINGDVINGSPKTALQVKQAYNNVVMPMESRKIPWALTFGNHDEDSLSNRTGMREEEIVLFLQQYRYNLNPSPIRDVYGHCNAQLLIKSAKSNDPAFGVWLLDSNRYAPDALPGQDFKGMMGYDWIRPNQIDWYQRTSKETERRHGKVQSLMFFHIPTFEHHHMWFGTQFAPNTDDIHDGYNHAAAVEKYKIVGEKHEGVYTGAFNSGIFAAALERGDVKGMFCGHDHINTYSGTYFGIDLGYGPGTGYGTYGLGGAENHRLRGSRVFELDENADGVYTGTRNVFARDLGVDTTAGDQKIAKPTAFPRYVR